MSKNLTHQYHTLYGKGWIDCTEEVANTYTGNPSIRVRKKPQDSFEEFVQDAHSRCVSLYIGTPVKNDGRGLIDPAWIDRTAREPDNEDGSVLWCHFPVCEPPIVASMNDTDFKDVDKGEFVDFDGKTKKWLTHWRKLDNSFFYVK